MVSDYIPKILELRAIRQDIKAVLVTFRFIPLHFIRFLSLRRTLDSVVAIGVPSCMGVFQAQLSFSE